ncbi:hypothetical protein S7711_00553 [Stachybotrys chartarum IBT 7711]|uniref:DUF7704 domain-containing protein n=1 Tax=Stachybotrys chartarum (strain CBS 109288 / IBT 7711) TaxID=1280523 RepID=A0A084ATQ0_STACB|nr:hypothetical protein S7711_00553 [Stachybotrys chartarum IBT 7711]KFA49740.1 hypothetical protein S40293_01355 [Stachybotrys chartarum IBT 40293]KFA79301.1 hypothetical protein S40288_03453 [Stachybotrys chartarum IBT 40288]
MASSLPPIPRLVFTVIEPISLVAGFLAAVLDPAAFIEQQVPRKDPAGLTDGAISVALQLGNLYLLLGFCGLAVFLSSSEVKVVRSYLFALWLGDIGHVAFSSYSLGADKLLRPAEWNAVAWGNIGFTIFLFTIRSLYFIGALGPDRGAVAQRRQKTA